MNNFFAGNGPDRERRALNIAQDPFAASEFFHLSVRSLLADILGLSAMNLHGRGRASRGQGVLGTVQAYIGTVEAQGRGMLHLHAILWLQDSPTSQEMAEALKSEEFRSKVRSWLDTNITADVGGLDEDAIDKLPRSSGSSFSRPLLPQDPRFEAQQPLDLQLLARSLQVHVCKGKGCIQRIGGVLRCKRRAPYQKACSAWVTEAGLWGPKCLHPFVVAFNPVLLWLLRCNHDVKLLTNAYDTSGIGWYITFYATKKQQKTSNASALLARRVAFHQQQRRPDPRVDELNKSMMNRCANTLNREQEFSAPEVIGYVMGWGDRYISQKYVTIYWDAVVYSLRQHYPELHTKSHFETIGLTRDRGDDETSTEQCSLRVASGKIGVRDQREEYVWRGDALEMMSYWDFFLDTYEETDKEGRGRAGAIAYRPGSPRKGSRRVRLPGHETLPQFVGRWFPSRARDDDRPLYRASMLVLFKPWRTLDDLLHPYDTLMEAFDGFIATCTQQTLRIMDNMEYYYISSAAAGVDRVSVEEGPISRMTDLDAGADKLDVAAMSHTEVSQTEISDEDIENQHLSVYTAADSRFAQQALFLAFNSGVFQELESTMAPQNALAKPATEAELASFHSWDQHIKAYIRRVQAEDGQQPGPVQQAELFSGPPPCAPLSGFVIAGVPVAPQVLTPPSVRRLNKEQSRAHSIIQSHVLSALHDDEPGQLLMIVDGPGGTGKSALIEALTDTFASLSISHWLSKTATSGVAATRIGGSTLHSWAGLGVATKAGAVANAAPGTVDRRKRNMQHTKYLLIDEFSMLTKVLLEQLSESCCQTKCKLANCTKGAFGGINVILFGDLHQFPPVIKTAALYAKESSSGAGSIGRQLFEMFTTVVTLSQQMRVTDPVWTSFLSRLREGDCTAEDISMVDELILGNPKCHVPDFHSTPWSDAVLVTSRNSVRDIWNEAALRRHAQASSTPIYISTAEDTLGPLRTPVSRADTWALAGLRAKKTGRLEWRTELAVGMRGMVQINIATESDLANGSRGVVTKIVLDVREPECGPNEDGEVVLRYPPSCIFFKLDHSSFPRIEGLDDNEIPIVPSEVTFTLSTPNAERKTIRRRQLAITPAYAFTDYKAQGQTIENVIVDLGESTHKSLDPFHAYVALSRSRGRATIRLLREFRSSLLTEHPSVDLYPEDARLAVLNERTAAQFDREQKELRPV